MADGYKAVFIGSGAGLLFQHPWRESSHVYSIMSSSQEHLMKSQVPECLTPGLRLVRR